MMYEGVKIEFEHSNADRKFSSYKELNIPSRKHWKNWDIYVRYNPTNNSIWAVTATYCALDNPPVEARGNTVDHLTPDNAFYIFRNGPQNENQRWKVLHYPSVAAIVVDDFKAFISLLKFLRLTKQKV